MYSQLILEMKKFKVTTKYKIFVKISFVNISCAFYLLSRSYYFLLVFLLSADENVRYLLTVFAALVSRDTFRNRFDYLERKDRIIGSTSYVRRGILAMTRARDMLAS